MGNNPDRSQLCPQDRWRGSPADNPLQEGHRQSAPTDPDLQSSEQTIRWTIHMSADRWTPWDIWYRITALRQHSMRRQPIPAPRTPPRCSERVAADAAMSAASDEAERHLVDVADQRDVETVSVAQE